MQSTGFPYSVFKPHLRVNWNINSSSSAVTFHSPDSVEIRKYLFYIENNNLCNYINFILWNLATKIKNILRSSAFSVGSAGKSFTVLSLNFKSTTCKYHQSKFIVFYLFLMYFFVCIKDIWHVTLNTQNRRDKKRSCRNVVIHYQIK